MVSRNSASLGPWVIEKILQQACQPEAVTQCFSPGIQGGQLETVPPQNEIWSLVILHAAGMSRCKAVVTKIIEGKKLRDHNIRRVVEAEALESNQLLSPPPIVNRQRNDLPGSSAGEQPLKDVWKSLRVLERCAQRERITEHH
jgi:hypothetical protein